MFDVQEFPDVYEEISSYVRVSRDLDNIPGGLNSRVTTEDCCIFIASCVEQLIQQGWEMDNLKDATDMVRAIVGAKISSIKETNEFTQRYTGDIIRILECTTPTTSEVV